MHLQLDRCKGGHRQVADNHDVPEHKEALQVERDGGIRCRGWLYKHHQGNLQGMVFASGRLYRVESGMSCDMMSQGC